MADIPDDILRAAGDAILKGGKAYKVGGEFHLAIARAIAAERERCAGIADGYGAQWAAEGIATAIREGRPA